MEKKEPITNTDAVEISRIDMLSLVKMFTGIISGIAGWILSKTRRRFGSIPTIDGGMMKTRIPIFCVLSLLVIGSGCTDFKDSPVNISANETPDIILHYENGNISVPVNVSQIEVMDPYYFTKNVTSVIAILFNDPRTGILLANGWNISSVAGATDEHDPNRTYTKVEFKKEGLSFFIGVDETMNRTLEGRCGAKQWVTEPISGPLPEDYHQWKYYDEDSSMIYYVIDQKNERTVMLYNETTIFYLYPSYATINVEGLND